MENWKKKLTKKELKHLIDYGCTDFESVKHNCEVQKVMREQSGIEPCWDCKFIAKKLGLPV